MVHAKTVQLVSLAAVGLAIDDEAALEANAACDAAQALLNELFPAVLATLRKWVFFFFSGSTPPP